MSGATIYIPPEDDTTDNLYLRLVHELMRLESAIDVSLDLKRELLRRGARIDGLPVARPLVYGLASICGISVATEQG